MKLPLLNRVLGGVSSTDGWLVVADDDGAFHRGDAVRFLRRCRSAGLDLAQFARADGRVDHPITRARRTSLVRCTTFIEIGPLFAVSPRWRKRVTPFPAERGMGFGLELEWLDLHREGCVLGVVDAVRVQHEGRLGEDYDAATEILRIHHELADRGVGSWSEIQATVGTWRPWQRAPKWVRAGRSP